MTLKLFEEEVLRFLASPEPEVLCITGEWGVGKTYAWNHYLQKAQKIKGIACKKYSYVSLFGRNSIDDVRSAIIESSVDSNKPNLKPSAETVSSAVTTLSKSFPKTANVQTFISRALFLALDKQLICVDDIERAGAGLGTKNILGLVSGLKNDKDCKVVILLNSEALTGTDKTDFEQQLEKVSDVILEFKPSAEECADVGVKDGTRWSASLRHKIQILGLTNIRVIKRIEKICKRLDELLPKVDERIYEQTIHFAALAAFAKFSPGKAPKLDFIKNFNSMADLVRRSGKSATTPDPEEDSIKFLRDYDFTAVDKLGSIIFEGVEKGFFDATALKETAADDQKTLELQDLDQSYTDAWEKFHSSFEADDDKVLDEITEAFRKCVTSITPLNANGTVFLLKEFGRDEQAKELVHFYVKNRDEKPQFWDMENSFYAGHVTDPDMVAAFNAKFAQVVPPMDTREVLIRMAQQSGWGREDEVHLAKVTPDDYYKIFKSASPEDFRHILKGAMIFRKVSGPSPEQTAVNQSVEEALKRIAKESPMNAKRVGRYLR